MYLREAVYLISGIITLESAIHSYFLNRHSLTNKVYTILTADFAVISFILYKISGSPDYESCMGWYNSNTIPGCLVPSLSLHLSLCITGNKNAGRPMIIALLYIPAVFFMIFMNYAGFFRSECLMTNAGWETVINFTSNYAYVFILYANLMLAASALIVIHWRYKKADDIERIHAKLIIVPYLAGIAGMFLCPYFLHVENNDFLNLIADLSGHALFVGFVVGIRLSVKRYSFMKISSDSPAEELIKGLKDPVFLVGVDGRIIQYNKVAEEILNNSNFSDQTSVFDIFDCPVYLRSKMNDIIYGKTAGCDIKCSISSGKNVLKSCILNIQSIHHAYGFISGLIVFVKEDLSINDFKTRYKITDRQFDLILLVVAGLSNKNISVKMNISDKTVENHLFNIYNKLGIDNKIQLFQIAQKYNIIPN